MLSPIAVWSTTVTGAVVLLACVTDLRHRRIPNQLTFPAIAFGLGSHLVAGGWGGVFFAAVGGALAPALLCLLHGGKGPGAGDLKLASVLGANLGPILGTVAILFSAVAGGFLAGFWAFGVWLRSGSRPRRIVEVSPESGQTESFIPGTAPAAPMTETGGSACLARAIVPYGLALSAGTIATLLFYWTAGGRKWPM
jgi:Flp pilus assembly protein protease CpaA